MQEGKTIGQLMEEMRQKAGAQNYHGHDYMDLQPDVASSFSPLPRGFGLTLSGGLPFLVMLPHGRCQPLR